MTTQNRQHALNSVVESYLSVSIGFYFKFNATPVHVGCIKSQVLHVICVPVAVDRL